MIHLRPDCLVFKMSSGENIPCSAEKVTIELMGDSAEFVDQGLIKEAAETVLHYFKTEMKCQTVSVAEFSRALEHVLKGLGLEVTSADQEAPGALIVDSDLTQMARASGKGFELTFFPLLREEMQLQLGKSPCLVRFWGLRDCVKALVGAKRWTLRCQALSDQIVDYMRNCLANENKGDCSLLVH